MDLVRELAPEYIDGEDYRVCVFSPPFSSRFSLNLHFGAHHFSEGTAKARSLTDKYVL